MAVEQGREDEHGGRNTREERGKMGRGIRRTEEERATRSTSTKPNNIDNNIIKNYTQKTPKLTAGTKNTIKRK